MTGQPTEEALAALRQAAGEGGWLDGDEAAPHAAPYLKERRNAFTAATPLILLPRNAREVARLLALCHRHNVGVVPQGGNTGLSGASVPHPATPAVLLSTRRLDAITSVSRTDQALIAGAGCTLRKAQDAAAAQGMWLPLSLASRDECRLGGVAATNAGGLHVLRYGMARNLILGLEVALADGRLWRQLSPLAKENCGYDLKQLFIGSEGTLGVITAVALRLVPAPRETATACVALGGVGDALRLLTLGRKRELHALTLFEYMEREALALVFRHIPQTRKPFPQTPSACVLLELSTTHGEERARRRMEELLKEAARLGLTADAVVAADDTQAQSLRLLREGVGDAQRRAGGNLKHDLALPPSRLAAFMEEAARSVNAIAPQTTIVAFGHLGDGNLHYNLRPPAAINEEKRKAQAAALSEAVYEIAVRLGGSISAEHGIGRLKRRLWTRYKGHLACDLMTAVKRALDPQGIMNPGVLFPPHHEKGERSPYQPTAP